MNLREAFELREELTGQNSVETDLAILRFQEAIKQALERSTRLSKKNRRYQVDDRVKLTHDEETAVLEALGKKE